MFLYKLSTVKANILNSYNESFRQFHQQIVDSITMSRYLEDVIAANIFHHKLDQIIRRNKW